MTTKAQMRGHNVELEPETIAELDANEKANAESEKLDQLPGVSRGDDGSWIFTLQYPLLPTSSDPSGKDITKIRVPAIHYCKHVRAAARATKISGGEADFIFHLVAAVSGVPEELLDRLHFRDYSNLISMMLQRGLSLPS